MYRSKRSSLFYIVAFFIVSTQIYAANIAELNEQIQNPVAALTSVPFQNNWTFRVGPEKRTQYVMNLQPVIPRQISTNWNLITRMVMPLVSQPRMATTIPGAFGLSNTGFTFFLSPINTSHFIWGVGPIISIPATNRALGSSRWGLGPSIVGLIQKDLWTVGVLANQVWTLGGTQAPNGINNLFLQPFISRSFWQSWNVAFTSETTANWNAENSFRWTVPLDLVVVKIFTIGKQAMTLGAGPRYFVVYPGTGPKWGARLVFSLLFPNN